MLLGYDYDRRKVFKERKSIIRNRQAPCSSTIPLVPTFLNPHIYIGIVQQFLSEVEQICAESLGLRGTSERKLNVGLISLSALLLSAGTALFFSQ